MVTATREVALAHAAGCATCAPTRPPSLTGAGLDPTDPASWQPPRKPGSDLYEVLVAYCLRNEDLASLHTRRQRCRACWRTPGNLAIINGDAEPATSATRSAGSTDPPPDPTTAFKMIAATKAIGHGFDVARLGVMVVMGTPTQAAEIIQASARVGRRWPGLVVNVINPTRDRDASVYRYYADWIRFLDRLVHKVPVNRESLPVLRRVLSGGLMAWLLQVHDRGWITGAPRRRSLAQLGRRSRPLPEPATSTRPLLIDNLRAGFGIHRDERLPPDAPRRDRAWVDDQLATLPLRADGRHRGCRSCSSRRCRGRCATSKNPSPSTATCDRRPDPTRSRLPEGDCMLATDDIQALWRHMPGQPYNWRAVAVRHRRDAAAGLAPRCSRGLGRAAAAPPDPPVRGSRLRHPGSGPEVDVDRPAQFELVKAEDLQAERFPNTFLCQPCGRFRRSTPGDRTRMRRPRRDAAVRSWRGPRLRAPRPSCAPPRCDQQLPVRPMQAVEHRTAPGPRWYWQCGRCSTRSRTCPSPG